MQTMKVLRTADFAPLMVFIAPTDTAAQVLTLTLTLTSTLTVNIHFKMNSPWAHAC